MASQTSDIDDLFHELKQCCKSAPLTDLRAIKPYLESIQSKIQAEASEEFVLFFESKVRELCSASVLAEAMPIIYLIDYCMRTLKWERIGEELKKRHSGITDLDVQLEVERLILQVFDSGWQGGEFHIAADDGSVWDSL